MYAHTAYGWNKVSLQTTKLRQMIYTYKASLLSCLGEEKLYSTHKLYEHTLTLLSVEIYNIFVKLSLEKKKKITCIIFSERTKWP